MRILTRSDVEGLLTMPLALEAVEAAFRLLSGGAVTMPQRLPTPVAAYEGLHLSMPAFVQPDPAASADVQSGALTIKVVTVYPGNPQRHGLPAVQGAILVHDAQTGTPLALMDAEHLTVMRTAAAAGIASRLLARPEASTLLLFGAGALAHAQVEAVCAVRPIRRVMVVSRSGKQDAGLCARLGAEFGVEAVSMSGNPALLVGAVAQADIITTATTSGEPLFDGAWLCPGAHINAMGAYRATQREVDGTTVRRSRVIVDRRQAAAAEAGDIVLAVAEGAVPRDPIAGELGEVLLGQVAGRTRDDEITLFKSVGLAVQDTLTAARVYAAAVRSNRGTEIDLAG